MPYTFELIMPLSFDWPFPERPTRYYKALSTVTIGLVGTLSRLWMKYLTSVRIENGDILLNAVRHRDPKRPLLTTANHHSCLDEPLLFGATIPYRTLWNRQKMRWALGADDIVFTVRKHQLFFSLGKTIPIKRGDGIHQRPMNFALEQLNQGDWVHIFPEGGINITKELIRLKWGKLQNVTYAAREAFVIGVGRLIAEANICPLVVPFYHLGMDSLLPNVEPYKPRTGQKVSIYVGEPLLFDDLLDKMRKDNRSLQEIRKAVTDVIQNEFAKLKLKCEELHRQHLADGSPPPVTKT